MKFVDNKVIVLATITNTNVRVFSANNKPFLLEFYLILARGVLLALKISKFLPKIDISGLWWYVLLSFGYSGLKPLAQSKANLQFID